VGDAVKDTLRAPYRGIQVPMYGFLFGYLIVFAFIPGLFGYGSRTEAQAACSEWREKKTETRRCHDEGVYGGRKVIVGLDGKDHTNRTVVKHFRY